MKNIVNCPHCGRKLAGMGHDEDHSVNELFCYFCEAQIAGFKKKKKAEKISRRKDKNA